MKKINGKINNLAAEQRCMLFPKDSADGFIPFHFDIRRQTIKSSARIRYAIPTSITLLRLVAAPFFYFTFLNSTCLAVFVVFIFAVLTDIADGKIARKMNATSVAGAFLDVITDFIFIILAFAAFVKKDWYSIFIFIPIVASFINFLIGTGLKALVYDPMGKYMGAMVMIMIGITLLIPYPIVRKVLTYCLTVAFMINITLRIKYLTKDKIEKN